MIAFGSVGASWQERTGGWFCWGERKKGVERGTVEEGREREREEREVFVGCSLYLPTSDLPPLPSVPLHSGEVGERGCP